MDDQHKFVKPTDIPNKISSDFYIEHKPVLKSNTHSHRSPASEFCMTRCSTIYNSSSGDTKECSLELNRSIKISSEYALPLLTSSPSMILNCSKLKKEECRRKYQLSTIKKKNNNSIEQVKHRKCHYDSNNSLYMTPFKLSQRKYVKNIVNSRKIFHTVVSIFSQLALLKIKTTDRNMHKNNSSSNKLAARRRFHLLPNLGTTSFFTLLTLVCLETVLLSTVSTCAKTFYMHWNTSNSM
ncbi:uncharacterized protein LOC119675213 [Teleopsis dalmanni]|uniref:uncharacterized protein LOC119675213 n=1 Tax=Teleopsis dalmanni TaxID=139649 RepID=UPI0018CE647D|nr:uncharacterized protein LOC119675213 [Teleopsis dalmanni]